MITRERGEEGLKIHEEGQRWDNLKHMQQGCGEVGETTYMLSKVIITKGFKVNCDLWVKNAPPVLDRKKQAGGGA
jgi:hypothetical protein